MTALGLMLSTSRLCFFCWLSLPSSSLSLCSFLFITCSSSSIAVFLNQLVFPVIFFLFLLATVVFPALWNGWPSLFLLTLFLSRPSNPQTMISLAFFLLYPEFLSSLVSWLITSTLSCMEIPPLMLDILLMTSFVKIENF